MNARSKFPSTALILAGGALLMAGPSVAQDQGSATTRALNAAPAQSTLTTRPNAQPPLTAAERLQASRPEAARPPSSSADRTLEDLLGDIGDEASADADAPTGVTLAEGETEPEPIPMTLGYYVRGDLDCNAVWPGDGDIAWATPTAFTIDYGGCEPGQFLQTGPNSWREEQRCVTETGRSAGGYSVTYEVLDVDTVKRTARLAIDDSTEEDLWTHCRTQDVSENARFASADEAG
ncbi:MAG: hypothetical protein KKA16_14475 [Alphaproteobacteria bacterium]|nr:hypothetical protein [Alphaproteobacteria bacterium]MBU2378735.1 hypothetical protein [Alphaproteobacteria bacterium]